VISTPAWRTGIPAFDLTAAILSIISAESVDGLFSTCVDCFDWLGFSEFSIGGFDLATATALPCDRMTTFDPATRDAYRRELAEVDPIMARTVRGGGVVHWDCSTIREDAPEGRFHDFLQDLRLRSGLNIPLQTQGSEIWGIVLASRQPVTVSPETIQQTFSLAATVLLKRTLLLGAESAPKAADDPRLELLSAEQREILRWVAHGKSNGDIALILGHSKRAIDYHVTQILRKLGVASRTQAAALLAT
jgi:LuxR family transcriptional regulator